MNINSYTDDLFFLERLTFLLGSEYKSSPSLSGSKSSDTDSDCTALPPPGFFRFEAELKETGAFVDLMGAGNATADEIQRRVILSQYLLAVNEAGHNPPQESGLVNNGWYGKFHMEMYLWHSAHWTPWGKLPLLERSIGVYNRFLPSSTQRAADQGYSGLRWGKMSDPSGRSAPGEINALLIWQQPHVFYFAESEYQSARHAGRNMEDVLAKWDYVLTESADFMASYAFWNTSTNVYDLGPPMYPVSENTPPNSTRNSVAD